MCNVWCLTLGEKLEPLIQEPARILDVGSRDVNGSLRTVLGGSASEYIGVDIEDGPSVDVVLNAVDIADRFGPESFDVVVSTEMIEHCEPWREALFAMVQVLRPSGHLAITTRSPGFELHGYPSDHWRFTREDMRRALEPVCEIVSVESDPTLGWACGVGVIARRNERVDLEQWREHLRAMDVYQVEPGVDLEGVHRSEIAEPLEQR